MTKLYLRFLTATLLSSSLACAFARSWQNRVARPHIHAWRCHIVMQLIFVLAVLIHIPTHHTHNTRHNSNTLNNISIHMWSHTPYHHLAHAVLSHHTVHAQDRLSAVAQSPDTVPRLEQCGKAPPRAGRRTDRRRRSPSNPTGAVPGLGRRGKALPRKGRRTERLRPHARNPTGTVPRLE